MGRKRSDSSSFAKVGSVSICRGVCAVLITLSFTNQATAQVAVSVGVQEVYDDNIYLEDDREVPIREGIDPITGQPVQIVPQKNVDGKVNDDLISHPYLSISGAPNLTEHLTTSLEGKVGAFFFGEETDENRLTLDTLLDVSAAETLIPQPFYLNLSSSLNSNSQDITVAEGSSARQSETHTAGAQLGFRGYEFAPQTDWAAGYIFERHDFLGEFLFSDRANREDEEGADYFRHGAETSVTRHVTPEFDVDVHGGVDYLDFTSVESNDPDEREDSELDRLDYNASVGFTYLASAEFQVDGEAGVNISDFTGDREPRTVLIRNPDGTESLVIEDSESNETSFEFRGGFTYTPAAGTALKGDASQSTGTNIDGDRLLIQNFSLDLTQRLGERYELYGRGAYLRFDEGDSLGTSTDRFELIASLRISLTESIVLSAGYAFARQEADEESTSLDFVTDDYENHRAFIQLDAGLVGVTS